MKTIPELFEQSVKNYPENPLMWEKKNGAYQSMSYKAMHQRVQLFAAGLVAQGIKRGDRVGLISEGRNDWVMSELGILYAGAINVPLSVKLDESSELKFRLAHAECKAVVISGGHFKKLNAIKNDLADLEFVILLDPKEKYQEDEIYVESMLQSGKNYRQKHLKEVEQLWQQLKGDDIANICYTSGTTADPKGILLSHRNYTANVEQGASLFEIPTWFVSLLILPWDHSFAHTAGIYALMKNGASMAAVESGSSALETIRNIPDNIKEIQPTFLLSVPALAKNFRKNIEKAIHQKGPRIAKLFHKGLETAYAYNKEGWNKGQGFQALNWIKYQFYDRIIFSKIRENFGGRLRFFVGGGALLDIELQKFFYALGIPMFQGYGLSEASPIIASNSPKIHKLGSSGKVVPHLQLKICDGKGIELPTGHKGEIVVKGENVMKGYWKNEKSTQETIRNGWLYTGDMGYLDQDGFLFVLGRFKSLLIGNDGEKYSPEGIEEAIVEHSPYIDQVMLYNNQNPYTIGLVVPQKSAILKWAEDHHVSIHDQEGQKAVLQLLKDELDQFDEVGELAESFPRRWLPAAIAILGEPFTEQNKLLNSTLKMVRGRIAEFYQNRIDYLYTAEGKDLFNHQNLTIISRF